jgi:phosphinothricin acetyltransferase
MPVPPAAVRPASPEDADAIARIYRPYVESAVASFEEVAPDAAEMRRRMLRRPRLPWFVAERDEVCGYAYASMHRDRAAYRWSADCSVYLAGTETGRGTGRALYDVLLPAVAALGYVGAFAGIALPNDASVRLHEAVGFTLVGVYRDVGFKHGRWHDVGWWQLRLAAPPVSPGEPLEWAPDGDGCR